MGEEDWPMPRRALVIELSTSEREELERLTRSGTTPQQMAMRARLVLLAASGRSNQEIEAALGVTKNVVTLWRTRFRWQRLEGLKDRPGRGRKRTYGHDERMAVIARSCEASVTGRAPTVREIAAALAPLGISKSTVGRMMKALDLKPNKVESWLTSRDPEFERKAAEVCGLYLNPPDNALVISVDEKTSIQALGRVVPDKPARPGSARKRDFEYVRHGTTSLFAALVVHSGEIIADVKERHSRVEFIEFLDEINRRCPKDRMIHVIADNLAVHKTQEVNAWLARHARFHMHFTPTHASWLNQVELFFSIFARQFLKDGIFDSKQELIDGILAYIVRYNQTSKPFRWTYDADPLRI
jgi:transposase